MSKLSSAESRAIAPLAERQLRRWAMDLTVQEHLPERALARLPEEVHPFVAISREAGAGGEEVGQVVAAALGCECLDQKLLGFLAERCHVPTVLVEFVDETTSTLIREVFRRWLDPRVLTADEFVMRLGEVMLMAARHAPAVFVGRGAQFVLPRDKGLLVRVIAPVERRIVATMTRRGLDRAAAETWVRDTDAGRAHFIRHQFRQDVTDPRLYDLVINLEHFDQQTAGRVILDAYHHRFGLPAAAGRDLGAPAP
ncbi:MAG: cytidylate kinase-like family protein [Candidatus Binatia bacterium]